MLGSNKYENGNICWQGLTHQTISGSCQGKVIYEQGKRNRRVYTNMEKDARKDAYYWRQVLQHIVNSTINLPTCNMAFRRDREIPGQPNRGNISVY